MRDPRALLGGLGLAALVAVGPACGSQELGPVDADWPAGALLSADRPALDSLLTTVAALERTPLGRSAAALRQALPDCDELEASAETPDRLHETLRCAEPGGALTGLHAHRGSAGVALVLPRSDGPRPVLLARRQPNGLSLELDWPDARDGAALDALLPGQAPAGPPVLAASERVLHLRVRSDALDLASLVPSGSQGDQLFRLKSALFSRALLDDTWELAIYPPADGGAMPRVALALGVHGRELAESALERFLGELEAAWSLQRQPLPFRRMKGACLPELRLMPELAPCALATEHALVLGWNPASLRHALDTTPAEAPADDAAARFEVDLTRLQQTDRRLAAALGGDAPLHVTAWPWQRLRGRGERRGGGIAVAIDLQEHGS